MTAVLFDLLGEKNGAEFFSRMSVASHGPERDTGHTGNFFNMLWSIPGVALSGPHATGAWMNEFGAWYFDLARRWDGTFLHQGPPEPDDDSYGGWDCTGGYLLAYAMPLKKIHLTGKRPGITPQLDAAAAQALILDGRGWDNKDRNSAYDKLSADQLLERLASWSPVVRERAAMALGRRQEVPIPPLVNMLESPAPYSRYGACQALIALGERGRRPLNRCGKHWRTRTSGCASKLRKRSQRSVLPPCRRFPNCSNCWLRWTRRAIRAACSSGICPSPSSTAAGC